MQQPITKLMLGITATIALIATALYVTVFLLPSSVLAAEAFDAAVDPSVVRWGFAAAASAAGLSAIAAGIAVAGVGAAAVGAIAEKPELFGRTLVLVGLAEGIAIYGLIIAVMILNRLG